MTDSEAQDGNQTPSEAEAGEPVAFEAEDPSKSSGAPRHPSEPPSSQAPASQAPASQAGQAPASQDPASTPRGELAEVDPLVAAKAEAQKYREQLLRTAADFDNFRKRSRREQEDALRKGKETTLKDLLPVFDNLDRAISSSEKAPDIKSVADGLRLVQRQFLQTLEKLNVKKIVTVGEPFDPARHEAIQSLESHEYPAGVVAAEVQSGYAIGDYLVRAALVAVSTGPGPEAGDAAAAEPSEDGDEDAPN